jgi:serine/threonine-protein kinase
LAASLDVPIAPVASEFEGLDAIEHQLTPQAAATLSDLDQFEAIVSGALDDTDGESPMTEEASQDAPTEVMASYEEPTEAIHTPAKSESDDNPFAALGVGYDTDEQMAPTVVAERKPMKNAGLVWGVGSGAVVFVIGMLVWLLTSISLPNVLPTGDNILVSDVTNQPFQQARDTLVGQKLLVHEAFEVSDTVPVDSVIRTDPTAGTAVGVNTLITVYVSSGKTQFAMPDLAGMNEKMAKDALDQAKLTLGTIVQAHSSTVPQGQIIESDPIAGTMIGAGTTVNLTVSDGLVDVPDVRNYSITEARSALNDSGLTVVLGTKDTCATAPQGTTVVDQSILPGTTQAGGTITLYVTCAP